MKIYLAGASKEIEEITPRLNALRNAGHTITFDWTIPVKELGASPTDEGQALKSAMDDLAAVKNADVVWLCAPKEGSTSTGAWFELGAAIASGVPVIISGPYHRCIFAQLAARRFETHDEALAYLVSCGPPRTWTQRHYFLPTLGLSTTMFYSSGEQGGAAGEGTIVRGGDVHRSQFQAMMLTKVSMLGFLGDDADKFTVEGVLIGGKRVNLKRQVEPRVVHFHEQVVLPGQLIEFEILNNATTARELRAHLVCEVSS